MKTTPKKNGGFTLVELIVVIAILAILAAVAIPAYSGYIEKAEKANDLQLLGAVNTAFAAACMAGGEDIYTIDGASIILDDGKVDSVSRYNDEFFLFYEGNEDAQFKVIKALMFDMEKRVFVDAMNSEGVTIGLPGGGTMKLTAAQAETILKSTYADMGGTALSGQINTVSSLASTLIANGFKTWSDTGTMPTDNTFFSVVFNPDYWASIGKTETDIQNMLGEKGPEATAEFLANSLVLNAAKGTGDINAEQAVQDLAKNPKDYIGQIKTNLNNPATAQDALADAALIYGVYTSYVNANYSPEDAKAKLDKVDSSVGLINALTEMQSDEALDGADKSFAEYMKGQGTDDLNAYLESMKVISEATKNESTAGSIMQNGFDDKEIVDLLAGILGK